MAFTPKQQKWRWYQDNAAEPTVALAGENTTYTILTTDASILRLRLTIAETGNASGSGSITLEYSTDESTWSAFGASAQWNYVNGAATHGNTLAGLLTSDGVVKGKYQEGSLSQAWGALEALEIDIAITQVNVKRPITTYYFRAKRDGVEIPLNSGETHPSITVGVTTGVNVSKVINHAVIGPPAPYNVSKVLNYAVVSPPKPALNVSKALAYAVVRDIGLSINVSKVVVYAVISETVIFDDGTPSGGFVFGGTIVEVPSTSYLDPSASGGIVFGGTGEAYEPPESHLVDGEAIGGIVFGGVVEEQWRAEPNNLVAIKGGTYRISGVIYTLANTTSYSGLGDIAALINCGVAPSIAGRYRYDLLSVGTAGTITLTAGTEATTPVMPATPTGEIKLDHVLRYYGQESISQADIGKVYVAPALTHITATAADDQLAWGETSTNITVYVYDQYGALYSGGAVIAAEIIDGNGTIAPTNRSGNSSSFVFAYTRGGLDPGDDSPIIKFTAQTGAQDMVPIILLNSSGDPMYVA